jgi:hypothetical protein
LMILFFCQVAQVPGLCGADSRHRTIYRSCHMSLADVNSGAADDSSVSSPSGRIRGRTRGGGQVQVVAGRYRGYGSVPGDAKAVGEVLASRIGLP